MGPASENLSDFSPRAEHGERVMFTTQETPRVEIDGPTITPQR